MLCEITGDGLLTDKEIARLKEWLEISGVEKLPCEKPLHEIIERSMANGRISSAERVELQKQMERVLPPSQRAEAKEARGRIENIVDGLTTEPSERKDERVIAPRSSDKARLKQQELEEAVAAHVSDQGPGEVSYELKIPPRRPYEANATMKQKDYLWGLGCRDQRLLDALGKWQASAMIDQIKKEQGKAGNGCLLWILLVIVLAGVIGAIAGS